MGATRASGYRPAARRSGGGRGWLATFLVALGTAVLLVSLPLAHLDRNVLDGRRFDDHATALVRDPVVRDALVTEITAEIVGGSGGAAAPVREQVRALTARVVASPAFERAWRRSIRATHRDVLDPDRRRIRVRIPHVTALTQQATGPLPPEIVELLQESDTLTLVSIARSRSDARTVDRARRLAERGTLGLVLATALLAAALALARRRVATLVGVGVGVAFAGAVLLLVELGARSAVVNGVTDPAGRRVAAAVWDELLGGFRSTSVILLAVGVAVAGVALAVGRGTVRAGR